LQIHVLKNVGAHTPARFIKAGTLQASGKLLLIDVHS